MSASVVRRGGLFALWICCCLWVLPAVAQMDLSKLPRVLTHDNVRSAGELKDGVLSLKLELREGVWHPDAEDAPGIPVLAFAEEGGPPSLPGPMIRVREGTRIHISFRNTQLFPVVLHGLHERPGEAGKFVTVEPGKTTEIDFLAGAPGTYFYRASCFAPVPIDGLYPTDTTMHAAFIVDPKNAPAANDRVMVITHWYSWLVPFDFDHGFRELLAINGKSWPHTQRLTYTVGETAQWRIINATVIFHPMHLHGAHFRVDSEGDGEKDTIFAPDRQRMVVTELMRPGRPMKVSWTPTHAGNWIFHCHLALHFDQGLANVAAQVVGAPEGAAHGQHDPSGMAGLIVGITVRPRPGEPETRAKAPERRLQLTVAQNPPAEGTSRRCISLELRDGSSVAATAKGSEVGPAIVLYRGQPTEITVVNKLGQQTAIHWHGIELESYYDGVPGWGGDSRQVTPPIAPGGSFVAHMTPPRAGTYIYHTHWHDVGQLTTGLYGPLIVLEPGQKYDPEHDRVFLVSRAGPDFLRDPMLVNGSQTPPPARLRAGESYRFRFINITPSDDTVQFRLLDADKPAQWQPLAKDGADLPEFYRKPREASETFGAGETYDYVFQPARAGRLSLETTFVTLRTVVPIEVVETPTVTRK